MTEPNGEQSTRPAEAHESATGGTLDELTALRERSEQAERDRDQYLALLRSCRAEFENYQKRARKEETERARYAHFDFALALLPVLDNLERAIVEGERVGEKGPLVQGVQMVRTQFLDVLRRHGITRMEALGQPFDPTKHQALMQQPSADHPPSTVINVFEHGYQIHDRVLRPAQVVVSIAPPEST